MATLKKTPHLNSKSTQSPLDHPDQVDENEQNYPKDTDSQELDHDDKSTSSRIIKKYPNRRLYDTLHSTYVTLFDIKGLVLSNISFHVVDAKTGEDLTRSILMQIILEEESGGSPMLSTQSLLQMIRFYGNSLQGMMSPFLEQNLNQFMDLQNQYMSYCQKMGGITTPETWLNFVNKQHHPEFVDPMRFLFDTGTKFLEEMQAQSNNVLNNFPFKKPK